MATINLFMLLKIHTYNYTWNVSCTLGSPDVPKVTDAVVVFVTSISWFASVNVHDQAQHYSPITL